MKTIKEKAKRYDEALERAKDFMNGEVHYELKIGENIMCWVFPELKESEDEKIRKALIEMVHDTTGDSLWVDYNVHKEDAIAWLEKQGEQKPAETEKGAKGNEREIPFSEQKPADKVEPKFKVGQTIKKEGFNLGFPIVKIENGFYYNDMGDNFPFTDQDNWKLVEQKPTDWSENDEEQLGRALYMMEQLDMTKSWDDVYNWLKSLRPQNRWKPSEGQLEALQKECIAHSNYELCRLLEQLKKLKE